MDLAGSRATVANTATTTAAADTARAAVASRSLRELAKLVGFLGKIGDDLCIELHPRRMRLATVNLSLSAFASCVLPDAFFESYTGGGGGGGGGGVVRCRVPNRAVLLIFKSKQGLEKTVERCVIKHLPAENRLMFQLQCKHGVTKTHKLTYEDCPPLQTNTAVDQCPNLVAIRAESMNRALNNFHSGLEEIEWLSDREKIHVHSVSDGAGPESKPNLDTSLMFYADDFETFAIKRKTKIAFNLKEFKAMLAFAESANQPIKAYYGEGGRPIIFEIAIDDSGTVAGPGAQTLMDIRVVLATMRDDNTQDSGSQSGSSSAVASQQPQQAPQQQQTQHPAHSTYDPPGRPMSAPSTPREPGASESAQRQLPPLAQPSTLAPVSTTSRPAPARNLQFPFQSSPSADADTGASSMALPSMGSHSSVPSPNRATRSSAALPDLPMQPRSSVKREQYDTADRQKSTTEATGSDDDTGSESGSPPPDKRQKRSMLD